MNKRRRYKGFNKRSKTIHIRVLTLIFCLSLIGVYGYTQIKDSKLFKESIFPNFSFTEAISSKFKNISISNIFKFDEDKENEKFVYEDISDELDKIKEDESSTSESSDIKVATIEGVTVYTIQVASIGEGQDLDTVEEKLKSNKIPYSVVEVDGIKKVQSYSSFDEDTTRSNLDSVRKIFDDAFISELNLPFLSLEYTSKYSYIEDISSGLNSLIENYKEESVFWEKNINKEIDLTEYNNILTKRLDIVEKLQENTEKIDYDEMNSFKENLIKYTKSVNSNTKQASKNANEDNYYLSKSLLLTSIQGYYSFINLIKIS